MIVFRYIVSNSFNFFSFFKDCFDKHGCNFYDVNEIGNSRPSLNKVILKKRLRRHTFCPGRHQ